MESSEQKGGFGTIMLVLLLALAFVVGTGLFAFIGYQFLNGGRNPQAAQPTATATPTPTAVPPTNTPVPTVRPPATAVPALEKTATPKPTVRPSPTARPQSGDNDSLPQTGLGPLATAASLLLAGAALGSRWLRRRS